jgi:hypothetical protein
MPRAEFEPAIPATGRPQTYALDRAATGIGTNSIYVGENTKTSLMQNTTPNTSVLGNVQQSTAIKLENQQLLFTMKTVILHCCATQ